MYKAVKVKLKPNKEQVEHLAQCFGCVRWVWNNALAQSIESYKATGKKLSTHELITQLPKLKKQPETEWLKVPNSSSLQTVIRNLDTAYSRFFKKLSGFPKFKSKHGKQTISYMGCKVLEGGYIKIPKLGVVRANLPQRMFEGFPVRTCTVSKNKVGNYYVSIMYEVEGEVDSVVDVSKAVGIDLGLTHFAILSNGEKIDNPKLTYKYQDNLKVKQQKLSRKKKGSKNREKARLKVAKVHNKIANSRSDFLHKLSRKIVDENQVICVENLNVKGMVKNRSLSKAISSVGWGMFCTMLSYKAKELGHLYQEIDRFYPSSKTCNVCGSKVDKLPLDVRSWVCDSCGSTHDRDVNAAINIKNEGLRLLGYGQPDSLSSRSKTSKAVKPY